MIILAWIYGLVIRLRNWMFDNDILPTRHFKHPIIGVGNLTVGGTGKTPHTEWLVRAMIEKGLSVATLSRGYKRKTRGFRLVTPSSTAEQVGDEPLQMQLEFPNITVAVDENRCHGISLLLKEGCKPDDTKILEDLADTAVPDVIILDDAYQHRYVKPGLNILLVDYTRPVYKDQMLPAGRLREPVEGKSRADIVIVTKCPKRLTPIDFRVIEQDLHLMPFQKLFFSSIEYNDLVPPFPDVADTITMPLKKLRGIENTLLLTGIANPEPLRQDLMHYCQRITPLTFTDHHAFSKNDAERINQAYRHLPATDKLIITTAKDATRLKTIETLLNKEVRSAIYVLPIRVKILREEERTLQRIVTDYVLKNKNVKA